MRIQRNFIDELITRVDIVEVINSYLPLHQAGREYKACCPFHPEKTPSFSVNVNKQFYYCFGCGAHGTAITFLMEYAHFTYVEAIQELAAQVGMPIIYEEGGPPPVDHGQLYEIMEQAAHYYRQQLRQPAAQTAVEYLRGRGLKGETARDFGLGYAPAGRLLSAFPKEVQPLLLKGGLIKPGDAGRYYEVFRDRIMFPIYNRQGRTIAFGGRALDKRSPKYLNSPETPLFQKGRELYGWSFVRRLRPLEKIMVVEGYMDVVMLAQHGLRNVVATLGTATTREQISRLFGEVSHLVFCFDGDEAGQRAAWRALVTVLPLLQDGRQVSFVLLPAGEDPDSWVRKVSAEGFSQYVEAAIPLSNFLFDHLKQQLHWKSPNEENSPEERAKLVEEAKKLLRLLPGGSYRDLMLQQLSQFTQLPSQKLGKLVVSPRPNQSSIYHSKQFSLIHQIIVYLLYQPTLAQTIADPHKLAILKQPDINLLTEIIELAKLNPHLTLATLCEHWRGSEYESLLNDLLIQKKNFLAELSINLEQEFRDAVHQLYQQSDVQRFEWLTQKGTLTEAEKQELKNLLRVS